MEGFYPILENDKEKINSRPNERNHAILLSLADIAFIILLSFILNKESSSIRGGSHKSQLDQTSSAQKHSITFIIKQDMVDIKFLHQTFTQSFPVNTSNWSLNKFSLPIALENFIIENILNNEQIHDTIELQITKDTSCWIPNRIISLVREKYSEIHFKKL